MDRGRKQGNNRCVNLNRFHALFMASYEKFVRYAYVIAGDKQNAEDVVQEAYIFAYETFRDCNDMDQIIPRIYDFIRNECIGYLKIKSLEKIKHKTLKVAQEDEIHLEEFFFRKEIWRQVVEVINNLKPCYRQVILLKYYGKLSIEGIASSMGIPPEEVHTLLQKAKCQILKRLSSNHGV